MDGNNLINEELHRRKCNNTCLLREEEDHCLITEGEGKISNGYNKGFSLKESKVSCGLVSPA